MVDKSKIIFTGGSGLLGTAFRKVLPEIDYPTSAKFNITDYEQMKACVGPDGFDLMIAN